mmetsp:Transcript_36447/g.89264  ORF Transcript_36447/g.89264 Transcript_36447/m.89264 type:complete len:92 (+) Transcript_36447:465-740(+)
MGSCCDAILSCSVWRLVVATRRSFQLLWDEACVILEPRSWVAREKRKWDADGKKDGAVWLRETSCNCCAGAEFTGCQSASPFGIGLWTTTV